jgi:hypothetical protein
MRWRLQDAMPVRGRLQAAGHKAVHALTRAARAQQHRAESSRGEIDR